MSVRSSTSGTYFLVIPCEKEFMEKWLHIRKIGNYSTDINLLNHLLELSCVHWESTPAPSSDRNQQQQSNFIKCNYLQGQLEGQELPLDVCIEEENGEQVSSVLQDFIQSLRLQEQNSIKEMIDHYGSVDEVKTEQEDFDLGEEPKPTSSPKSEEESLEKRKTRKQKSYAVKKKLPKVLVLKRSKRLKDPDVVKPKPVTPKSVSVTWPKKRVFGCPVCPDVFDSSLEQSIPDHLNRNHDIRFTVTEETICRFCKKGSFPNEDGFREHLRSHIADLFLCPQCDCVYNTKDEFKHHYDYCANNKLRLAQGEIEPHQNVCYQLDGKKVYACLQCDNVVAGSYFHLLHVTKVHESGLPCRCLQCGRQFDERPLLLEHLVGHFRCGTKQCAECGKSFSKNGALANHIEAVHNGVKQYSCEHCDKSFFYQTALLTHRLRIHREEHVVANNKRLKCPCCIKSFVQKTSLEMHVRNKHAAPGTSVVPDEQGIGVTLLREEGSNFTHKCLHCEAVFKNSKSMMCHAGRAHRDLQTKSAVQDGDGDSTVLPPGEKRKKPKQEFFCKLCGKQYSSSTGLIYHRNTVHLKIYPAVCDICGQGFGHASMLWPHKMGKHFNHLKKQCKVCGKEVAMSGMKNHMRLHTGDKPCLCQFCGKAFAQIGHRMSHERIHTNSRPYKCEVCEFAFKQSGDLKRHVERHGGQAHTTSARKRNTPT